MSNDKVRELQKRAVKYVKMDRPHRLEEFVKKYYVDLKQIELNGVGNLLHWCLLKDASGDMLDYLLSQGVSPMHRDSHGDLPIDLAINRLCRKHWTCIQRHAAENIFPLLCVTRHGWRNHLGFKTTSLYKQELENCLKRLHNRWTNLLDVLATLYMDDDCFQEKFRRMFQIEQRYFDPFPGWSGADEEAATADNGDWFESVEKMRAESNPFHWFKPSTRHHHPSTSPPPPQSPPSSSQSQPRSSAHCNHDSTPPPPPPSPPPPPPPPPRSPPFGSWSQPRSSDHCNHASTPPPPPPPPRPPSFSSCSQPRSNTRCYHTSTDLPPPPRPPRRPRPPPYSSWSQFRSNTRHHHFTPPPPRPPPSSPFSQPRSKAQSRLELVTQKADYERRFEKTMRDVKQSDCCLTFNDIPWPAATADSAMKVLFVDLEEGSDEYRNYLRWQLRRWHPDKFDQILGCHLCQEDKPKIMVAVKELAQCLNKLAEQWCSA